MTKAESESPRDGRGAMVGEHGAARLPKWVARTDRALSQAARVVRVIGSSTPRNFRAEIERLVSVWERGRAEAPSFEYTPCMPPDQLDSALCELARDIEQEGPLGQVYASRARELADEAVMCATAGRPEFWAAARRRYAPRDEFDAQADELSASWLSALIERSPQTCVRSDDDGDPASLTSRLRQELGARRVPLRVLVSRDLASLAATGEEVVQVVADRQMSHADVERTVLHEVEGHVMPRVHAATVSLGIFVLGTARGSDDQEGRAIALERAAGFLDGGRRRELALRHTAARSVERRETFVDTVRLLASHEASVADVVRIAARAHRGGGLAREAVYLPALLRFESAVRRDPGVDATMRLGRVAVDAVPLLAGWF